MTSLLAECGLVGEAAEDALNMLRSLVRGYVLNEMMHTFVGVQSYDESFDKAVQVFVAGLPALDPAAVYRRHRAEPIDPDRAVPSFG